MWRRWVAWCAREGEARPLHAVRVLVCMTVVLDLLSVWWCDLGAIFVPFADGGIAERTAPAYVLDVLLPSGTAGLWASAVAVLCLSSAAMGVAVRPMLLVGVLAWAQLGHLFPGGDRAIDRLLRGVLLLLAVAGPDAVPFWRGGGSKVTAVWPAAFIRWLLVLVYLSAGLAKVTEQPAWIFPEGRAVLYRIVASPMSGSFDPMHAQWGWLWRPLGQATVLLELTSPFLLTRWAPVWGLGAITMHLGIAATMHLGLFSWGMLALYPVVYGDRLFAAWDRWRGKGSR